MECSEEAFVPLSAVICQLDEDTLINSKHSSPDTKSSGRLTLSEYEDVESDDEAFYKYATSMSQSTLHSTSHSLSNEENNFNGIFVMDYVDMSKYIGS